MLTAVLVKSAKGGVRFVVMVIRVLGRFAEMTLCGMGLNGMMQRELTIAISREQSERQQKEPVVNEKQSSDVQQT